MFGASQKPITSHYQPNNNTSLLAPLIPPEKLKNQSLDIQLSQDPRRIALKKQNYQKPHVRAFT